MFKLPPLPYAKTALAPFLNEEQMTFHYEKHHNSYIDNLNKLLEADTATKGKSLEEIVISATGGLFNNAAQAWNHTFYWKSMAPKSETSSTSTALQKAIQNDFNGFESLKTAFIDQGTKIFGSGWMWLCADNGKLSLISTSNAAVPFVNTNAIPLLVADVWEHAYYIDYRNLRPKYLEAFWNQINWKFASENFESKKICNLTKLMT